MSAEHPAVDPAFRSSPLATFFNEPVKIESAEKRIAGTVDSIWRWFTGGATGIHVLTTDGRGDHIVLGDDDVWTITHVEQLESYTHNANGNPFVANRRPA
ncbi:Uncharacterised protein [Mycobacteroides abscessus subsp. abscessus]|nr:Uncharacterised protein [Mycobacteroides abscessus subsp. abscessus]